MPGQQVAPSELGVARLWHVVSKRRQRSEASAYVTPMRSFIRVYRCCELEPSEATKILRERRCLFRCVVLVNLAGQSEQYFVCGSDGMFPETIVMTSVRLQSGIMEQSSSTFVVAHSTDFAISFQVNGVSWRRRDRCCRVERKSHCGRDKW